MYRIYRLGLFALIGLVILSSTPAMGLAAPLLSDALPTNLAATSPTAIFRVGNKTHTVIPMLVLTGPKKYVFYRLAVSNTEFVIEKGRYRIEYTSCGIKRSFVVDIKSDLFRLRIARCQMNRLVIQNQTGGDMTLSLSGPASYQFKIVPGLNRFKVIDGPFNYRAYAICGSKSGRIHMNHGRVDWSWSCPQPNVLDDFSIQ